MKFEAKEKYPSEPIERQIRADVNYLRPLGATEFFPRKWQYLDEKNSRSSFFNPSYFDSDLTQPDNVRDHLRVGDELHWTMCNGSRDPRDWERGVAIVIENVRNSLREPMVIESLLEHPMLEKPKSKAAA